MDRGRTLWDIARMVVVRKAELSPLPRHCFFKLKEPPTFALHIFHKPPTPFVWSTGTRLLYGRAKTLFFT